MAERKKPAANSSENVLPKPKDVRINNPIGHHDARRQMPRPPRKSK